MSKDRVCQSIQPIVYYVVYDDDGSQEFTHDIGRVVASKRSACVHMYSHQSMCLLRPDDPPSMSSIGPVELTERNSVFVAFGTP